MGGILVLVLSLSMAATQDKPVAPVEQYRALLKEFGDAAQANWKATTEDERKQAAARVEPLPLKLLELAEKNPFGGKVGDNAKMELFAIRHLAVGKEAADIEGPDQNGVRFKLSDYRGKVVLLYFWQHV